MEGISLVTGADRGLGLAMANGLLEKGWYVFAGQYLPQWTELEALKVKYPEKLTIVPLDVSSDASVLAAADIISNITDHVDLLVNNAGISSEIKANSIIEEKDYEEMLKIYNVNTLGQIRVVKAFKALTDRSQLKRLCFISSEAGSVNLCGRVSMYGYCMSKAALNMGIKIMFNSLRPEGYSFRVYHPGWLRSYMTGKKGDLEPCESAAYAIAYFLRERYKDLHNPSRNDEDRLALRDWRGQELPW
jgi:NAD(P)-dependent dehydrogenase (short-subunit alcohol dehydrogenase family)